MTEEGLYTGGTCPYGYQLVKNGRVNKHQYEIHDLAINPDEAEIVKTMFRPYVYSGYGPQRIATYLTDCGVKNRRGKVWSERSIRNILQNVKYTGILVCGTVNSKRLNELVIVDSKTFQKAQFIFSERSKIAAGKKEGRVPLNTKGQSLLNNNVFCGHCGSRLLLTTSGKGRKRADDSVEQAKRIRYNCYGKTRKLTDCRGQTGYTMSKLDGIIDDIMLQIFRRVKALPKKEIVQNSYQNEISNKEVICKKTKEEFLRANQELEMLKIEIVKSLRGESAFPSKLIGEMVEEVEIHSTMAQKVYETASSKYNDIKKLLYPILKINTRIWFLLWTCIEKPELKARK